MQSGLGAAITFIEEIGIDVIATHENKLLKYATSLLQDSNLITLFAPTTNKAGIISFIYEDIHPHDIGTILDQEGIAVRVGHHCAQPTMQHFGITGTVRASLGLYNTMDDIDSLVNGLDKVKEIFS